MDNIYYEFERAHARARSHLTNWQLQRKRNPISNENALIFMILFNFLLKIISNFPSVYLQVASLPTCFPLGIYLSPFVNCEN